MITCDWPGWGLTLGWQADFWGDSCPQSPLREGHSSEQEGNLRVHGEQSPLAGGRNSCPNEDSELQHEATGTHFQKGMLCRRLGEEGNYNNDDNS